MSEKESNQAVRRTCRILKALAGHAISGVSNKELAAEIDASEPTTLRLLQTLAEEGMVVQYEKNLRWALSIQMQQIAQATENELTRAMARTRELQQRIHAGANAINNA